LKINFPDSILICWTIKEALYERTVKMRNFESDVQLIKYKVLKEVAKYARDGSLKENYDKIPETVIPGPKPMTRCCIYKERAIVKERVKLAMGGNKENPNVIEVINEACDECPVQRYTVTEACRGCLAHKCKDICPVNAIYYIDRRSYIDTNKCIECGKCKDVCPYNAISDVMRPCKKACKTSALFIDKDKKANIDNEKCIQCGACVYQCPFGAIMDKSFIVNVIDLLNEAKRDKDIHVYAIVAPSISSQFTYARVEQVVTGIKLLGFYDVVETALGADIVALNEAKEFKDNIKNKKFITSSCCTAFVSYIKKYYPQFKENISATVSPMIAISRFIKSIDNMAKVVFIGPCTAKKAEIHEKDLEGSCDFVITFEELQAMLDAYDIKVEECEDNALNNASFYGRIFARSGGVTETIKHVIKDNNMEVDFKPVICSGVKECDRSLKIAKFNRLQGNYIEGMACQGGCIEGAASLCHGAKDKSEVDKYANQAMEKSVNSSLRVIDTSKLDLKRK
jgi:[FeFe] hydrogenase (group B1/B3)